MRILSRKTRKSITYLGLVLALFWIGFGPVQLGGPVSYIVISGNSMEPEIEKGDLVVTRKASQYQLDQRVVYDHPELGFVFHRIVDQEDGRFILQGDNNDWLDSYHPSGDEIRGKYWYAIPGAGEILITLRQPLYFGLFIIITSSLVAGLVLMPDPASAKRTKGKRNRMKKENPTSTLSDLRQETLLVLGILAVIVLIVGLVALSKKPKITVNDNITFKHAADLEYSASAAGGIYDHPGVETGDPLYPPLSCVLDLDFSYQFTSSRFTEEDRDQFEGTFSLSAEVRDNDGWHRTIRLVPEKDFSTQKINVQPSLNICEILALIEEKETKTGLDIKIYTLSILPEMKINGTLEGLPVEADFQPAFIFDLSESVLRVPHNSEGFDLEQEGQIPHMFEANNRMSVLGKQVPVIVVRWTAFSILTVCILAGAYLAWSLFEDVSHSEHSKIEIIHRPVMIDLKDSQIRRETYTLIDLESMGDLRKLADRYGAMIMHEVEGSTHRYLVIDDGFLYQFETDQEQGPKPFSGWMRKDKGEDSG